MKQLPADNTWKTNKNNPLTRLGEGNLEEEAWNALEWLKRDVIDLGVEAEKLSWKAHPGQPAAAEQQAI